MLSKDSLFQDYARSDWKRHGKVPFPHLKSQSTSNSGESDAIHLREASPAGDAFSAEKNQFIGDQVVAPPRLMGRRKRSWCYNFRSSEYPESALRNEESFLCSWPVPSRAKERRRRIDGGLRWNVSPGL